MVNLHLKRSTWTLVGGLVAAGVVLAAGAMNANRLQEMALKASICDLPVPTKEDLQSMATTKPFDPDAYLQDRLAAEKNSTVDPDIAAAFAEKDAEKAEAKRIADCRAAVGAVPDEANIRAAKSWPRLVAAIIAALSALPWFWYFLLRRIVELRAAFSGKPPAV